MDDKFFMKEAIKLAKKAKGYTHPNPTVGAVIVKDGKIIGKGYHKKAGMPHAEVEAIEDALSKKQSLEGATIYVTLEPCCHYGKTPPCTNAILNTGIKRVVIATLDPNPKVSGKGVQILRNSGLDVKVGVLEDEAKQLNEDFFVFIKEKRPFIHLKWAQSIDGKISTFTGSSKWITGKKARKHVHKMRKQATAVMVGTNTALKDNPSLTVRYVKSQKQPVRVLIDKKLIIPDNYNILNEDTKTIIFTSELADKSKLERLAKRSHIEIIQLPLKNDKFAIDDILKNLYERDIVHLLIEGGKDIITDFIRNRLFDKISVFIAPKIIGEEGVSCVGKLGIDDINKAVKLKKNSVKTFGEDVLLEFYPEK